METALVIFLIFFITFWGFLTIGQMFYGRSFMRRFRQTHGRLPGRDDVSWWQWQLINPIGLRKTGGRLPDSGRFEDADQPGASAGGQGNSSAEDGQR